MPKSNVLCLFIRGLPGSGKTTLAKEFSSKYKSAVLDPDEVPVKNLSCSDAQERLKTQKYNYLLNSCVNNLAKSTNVVWSQPWRKTENIKITRDRVASRIPSDLSALLIFLVAEIYVNKDISRKRSKSKFPNRAYYENYISKYKSYDLDIPLIKLDGKLGVRELSKLLYTEVERLIKRNKNYIKV
jgi:adenylate kinase family enzyme